MKTSKIIASIVGLSFLVLLALNAKGINAGRAVIPPRVLSVILTEPVMIAQKGMSVTNDPVRYQLQIPENYFSYVRNRREAVSPEGATFLALWTLYPSFSGHSSENYKEFNGKISPNKSIRFSLRATKPSRLDSGSRHLNAALQQSDNSHGKIRLLKAAKNADELTEYEFINQPGRKAYTWKGNGGLVYFDCSYTNLCTAYKTWGRIIAVEYYFFRAEFSDFREIDRGLDELINSFHPVQKN